ncbi:hypothetical protein A0O34_04840 [Chryseobacterium glaciei]|uniref:Uncharacterized protein n=1 Tax=Chryseobacterium glaciei TaxID=1685010 RepID=A0A172XST0_9FLAO|nr:hypothetical protein [Chryseobacterium glaciei]ANF49895.1 hypothetical protein A0O34_04840 [Chryseobacterium glaciei]
MIINFSQIVILILIITVILFLWIKYKLHFITNFFIGGILLMLLSSLKFFSFNGKLDILSMVLMTIFYIILNISTLFIYLFKDKTKNYFVIPAISFAIIIIFEFLLIDPGEYNLFKLGIITRLFLSFFPLLILTYYFKFLKK